MKFFIGIFCPPLLVWQTLRGMAGQQVAAGEKVAIGISTPTGDAVMAGAVGILYFAWVLLLILTTVMSGAFCVGWACYVGMIVLLSSTRHNVRRFYRIEGSGPEDFFVCLLFYPQALAQIATQVTEQPKSRQVDITI